MYSIDEAMDFVDSQRPSSFARSTANYSGSRSFDPHDCHTRGLKPSVPHVRELYVKQIDQWVKPAGDGSACASAEPNGLRTGTESSGLCVNVAQKEHLAEMRRRAA
jgi:hypothetical protein